MNLDRIDGAVSGSCEVLELFANHLDKEGGFTRTVASIREDIPKLKAALQDLHDQSTDARIAEIVEESGPLGEVDLPGPYLATDKGGTGVADMPMEWVAVQPPRSTGMDKTPS